MSEYDFEAELRRLYGSSASAVHYQSTDAALRRAYAAGQASGGGSDLDRLVTLAAGHSSWRAGTSIAMQDAIARECASMIEALKAKAEETTDVLDSDPADYGAQHEYDEVRSEAINAARAAIRGEEAPRG